MYITINSDYGNEIRTQNIKFTSTAEISGGFWSNPKTKVKIKEAYYDENVKFTIGTKNIPNGATLKLRLKDYDQLNYDDFLKEYTVSVKNNLAILEFAPEEKWNETAKFEADKVVEVYFEIEYIDNGEKIIASYPESKDEYLTLYEQEVKITVIVELPHSKETGWGAKGLAGHTAMAIGDKFFDYGPSYAEDKYYEKVYDYDFNNDGDKKDTVTVTSERTINKDINEDGDKYDLFIDSNKDLPVDYKYAPGMPWWGTFIASEKSIGVNDVTLAMVLKFIQRDWRQTGVYGEVHILEILVNKYDAEDIKKWWENRYEKLKLYSVWPWKGEQCTTTVKAALKAGNINIPTITQTPQGILDDLKKMVNSSNKSKGQKIVKKIIKKESNDWPN